MLEWTGSTCVWFPNSCAFDSSVIPANERYYAQSIKPLDIISFDFDNPKDYGGDHVGIVLDVYDWGCHTIEGNTDIVVKERDRYWDDILFGIRPQWNEEEMISEEDKRDIARYCAEYVYGEEDTKDNLNMYNATHWAYKLIKELRDLVKEMKGNK
jgi:hypothetical protein